MTEGKSATPPAKPQPAGDVRRIAIALAALVFAVAAPAAYGAQRIFERVRSGATDPLLVVFDLHTSFYWRASTAAWWGVVAAIVTFAFTAQSGATDLRVRLARTLAVAAVPLAVALALALWRLP